MSLLPLLLAAWSAWAAAAPAPKALPGVPVELRTPDGWTLAAQYVPAQPGELTFVLLHGTGQRKEEWLSFANALTRQDYGFLALDFRGHGASTKAPEGRPSQWRQFKTSKADNEYANMIRDVDSAVAYLVSAGLTEDKIALVGADLGSSLALKYAAVHVKTPLLVMLSPGTHYQEVLTVNAMRAYRDRPILMVYATTDKTSAKATPLLHGFAKLSAGEKMASMIAVEKGHGTRMLKRALIDQILDWIAEPVKPEAVDASTSAAEGAGQPGAEGSEPSE